MSLKILKISVLSLFLHAASYAAPPVPASPLDNVTISGDVIDLCGNLEEYETKISNALKGQVLIPNADVVKKGDPPKTIPYQATIEFKKPQSGRRTQPTSIGLVTLVSDDGCDITVNGEKWLNECGKGHDISKGKRVYPKILLDGRKNTFSITYSQTYYDPDSTKEDLDGISLIVAAIPIDISVRKENDAKSMNNRVLVTSKEKIEFALHPNFFNKENKLKDKIKWKAIRMNAFGKDDKNINIGSGTKGSIALEPGIYKIQATINEKVFSYERKSDVPHNDKKSFLLTGASDSVGVVEDQRQINLVNLAYSQLGSVRYAQSTAITVKNVLGPFISSSLTFAGEPKCNIFTYEQVNDCKMHVSARLYEPLNPFKDDYYIAPLVSDWKNSAFKMVSANGYWLYLNTTETPQPGFVVTANLHMGIIDYDGTWINAGEKLVHKRIQLQDGAGLTSDSYPTKCMRKFQPRK